MKVEKEISDRLGRIFGIQKVTFNLPSESQEQQAVFVNVSNSHVRIVDAREIVRVVGEIIVFANSDKLPIGFFSKKISAADLNDTRGFFFGPEENAGTVLNIARRKFDFTFLFDSQYDPAIGSITDVNMSLTEI